MNDNKSLVAGLLALFIVLWLAGGIFVINTTVEKVPDNKIQMIEDELTAEETKKTEVQNTTRPIDTTTYGIGINVAIGRPTGGYSDVLYIITVQPGSPASKAGLKVNDVISAINGKSTSSIASAEQASALIRGKTKTFVKLTIYRDGEYQELSIPRDYKLAQ